MINYLKLQFNYLFSKVFVFCFIIIILMTFLGVIISSNIDLGYNFIDAFINEYEFDYSFQSLLIIEIVSVIISIFVAGVLGSKNNDYLVCYCCNSYFERFLYFLSRIIILVLFALLFVYIQGVFISLFTRLFTPYKLNKHLVVNGLISIFFISIYFSAFTSLLLSLINHFIMISLPFFIFWYLKTITSFNELNNDLQKSVLILFPNFIIKEQIYYFQEIYIYLSIYIAMFLINISINTFKDY